MQLLQIKTVPYWWRHFDQLRRYLSGVIKMTVQFLSKFVTLTLYHLSANWMKKNPVQTTPTWDLILFTKC